MGRDSFGIWGAMPQAPSEAPVESSNMRRDEQWSYENSVSAVSFGFVATAILISMFLVMAIFEKFLRPRSPDSGGRNRSHGQPQLREHGKLEGAATPQMTVYAKGVSVLMPGEAIPTFIAHPAPVPCSPEPHLQALHQHIMLPGPSSSSPPRPSLS